MDSLCTHLDRIRSKSMETNWNEFVSYFFAQLSERDL